MLYAGFPVNHYDGLCTRTHYWQSKVTPVWLKLIPAPLRAKVEHRPNLQKALTNTGWLFGDQILRMGVGLMVGVWVARYLGPEQFGLLNYAMAIVALFGAVASLGLNGIVVRDMVKEPETANTTLGTAFLLQIFGGLLAFALAVFTISFTRSDDALAKLIVAVLGFVMVFKSTEVVKYWFESQVQSKYIVWVENGVFLILSVVKVGLILAHASLMAFVWAAFVEGLLVAIGLLGMYAWRGGLLGKWRIRYGRAKALLKDSWPLILSGLAVIVYTRIDQVMLGQMLGDKAVGIYSAAVRISEVWYFIPMAIVASAFPSLMQNKDQSSFEKHFQRLFDLMFVISFPLALSITVMSDFIIRALYGVEFAGASEILSVYAWALVFAFMGVPSGRWYLYANLQKLALYRTAFGGGANILLNMVLIPEYGPVGAAYSTLVAIAISNFLFNAFNKRTFHLFVMQVRSVSLYSFQK
jgi:O-antigen/teichoic acid export membrane protein